MGHNITILKNCSQKGITNLEKNPQLLNLIFSSQLQYSIQIWPLLGPILFFDFTRIAKFPNFGKMKEDQVFHRKKYAQLQVKNFKSLFGRDILLWNCFEEFGKVTSKKGFRFTPSSKYFISFKGLGLSYNLPYFVPVFKKIDKKLAQI